MQRISSTHLILAIFAAALSLGWTVEELPSGHTTVTRGDVIYADEGSTIQVYRASDDEYEFVTSFETQPQATHNSHDDDHGHGRRHKHRKNFSCSVSHTHDHDDHGHDHHHSIAGEEPADAARFVAAGASLFYVFGNSTVVLLDISKPLEPYEVSRVTVEWKIETLDVIDGEIVIGGSAGSYIVKVNDSAKPTLERLDA